MAANDRIVYERQPRSKIKDPSVSDKLRGTNPDKRRPIDQPAYDLTSTAVPDTHNRRLFREDNDRTISAARGAPVIWEE
jgi:hypothetical protein